MLNKLIRKIQNASSLQKIITVVVFFLAMSLTAGQSGDFTYWDNGSDITITKYTGAGGAVTIPDSITEKSVTSIGFGAFQSCLSLTSVTIPSGVTSIGDSAFEVCTSLTSVTIPSSVTSIGNQAFCWCWSLTSIIIPNSVTSIGVGAFSYCSSLTSVTIPSSVTSIGDQAFCACTSLTSVIIPNSVTSIGDSAFVSCSSLTSITIGSSVTSIGNQAFCACTSLTSVTIPSSVTSIGESAFSDCSSLTSISVSLDNLYYSSEDVVLFDKEKTILIQCPQKKSGSYIIPNTVTSIEVGAFSGCSSLTSITIPNSVTSIGDDVFSGCSGLTSVTIGSGVTRIGDSAFSCCESLTSITIPSSVTSIGESAFSYCYELTSITIPNSVTSIGASVFSCCSGLTSVTIPNSVTSIGDGAFEACESLTTISVSLDNLNYSSDSGGVLFNKGKTVLIQCPGGKNGDYTIPNSVTSIGDGAFGWCSGLTSVTIPNSVTSIGDGAFNGCSSLTSAIIGSGVTSIGGVAFYNCKSLASVYFLGDAPIMGDEVFSRFASGFTVYFINGKTGFTLPTWKGYPSAIWTTTITASAGLNGSISPSGTLFVNYAADKTFTITSATGYHIADVLVDNISQGTISSYTFTGVTENHTISTTFAIDAGAYSISGTVSGDVTQGVKLILSGTGSSTNTSAADGTFTFAGRSNGSYTVTPSIAGYTFDPTSRNITISGKNVTGCDFIATRNQGQYSLSGTIKGDVLEGVTVTLSDALSSSTVSDTGGAYTFTGLTDGDYTVTPELADYTFDPFSQDVTIDGVNQPGIDFTATAISIYGEKPKLSFNSSHKEAVKKIAGAYSQYSTDKFTIQATIQFPADFNLATIGVETGFTFNFGFYSFSGTLGNDPKTKLNGANGGSATFKIIGDDAIMKKKVTVEKVDIRWGKNKKLTVKITGTPASNSGTNVVDLSSEDDSISIMGNIDTFTLTFNNAGAGFADGESLDYTGKKTTKTVIKDKGKPSEKTFTLVNWSAKGKQ